jgi:cytochrome b/b6/petD-like protein
MYANEHELIESMAVFLGWFYAVAAGINVWAAVRAVGNGRRAVRGIGWAVLAGLFAFLAYGAFVGRPAVMPEAVKAAVDGMLGPVTFTFGVFSLLTVFYLGRSFFTKPAVAWSGLNGSLLFMGLSLTDAQFAAVVTKPDNVPIVAMVYLLAFFTWLGARQAVQNDRRAAVGKEPIEKDFSEKALVWPDLVYVELIVMVALSAVLIVWSLGIDAPLEQPANPVVTPNPSKAPWYFLGLQEMLVFFDPSIAGVTLPVLIIVGLVAIPYIDPNPRGSGYYTIAQRKFAYVVFLFGFLQLWVLLILIGTFMRGPNWNFFALYEYRDPHKVTALNNVKLSEYFWVIWLGYSVPQVSASAGALAQMGTIALREIAGLVSAGAYFVVLPVVLGRTWMKDFRRKMGRARYTIMILLLLMMATLPLKMILRWTMNLSYIVSIPEYFFNF